MKKLLFLLTMVFSISFLVSCGDDDDDENNEDIDLQYKQKMREFVIGISEYSKGINSTFCVIPQNGIELASNNGDEDGEAHSDYLNAIDGNGQEDLFYGYDDDDKATPADENAYLRSLIDLSKNEGNTILVTDYCSTPSKMEDSYVQNSRYGYISFAAKDRELTLNVIPDPIIINNENKKSINDLSEIQNFLYLINPEGITSKEDFIDLITSTNYDLLIMDLFFDEDIEFTGTDVEQLRKKANGGKRLVVCYMSIGEAEDYRYYWNSDWETNSPEWLDEENPDWPGNYKVKYWIAGWQEIIYGSNNAYLDKIIDASFDGVYLDIIEAFEYYE